MVSTNKTRKENKIMNELEENKTQKLMMRVFNFRLTKSEIYLVCGFCGKRIMKTSKNDRMINHYTKYHNGK